MLRAGGAKAVAAELRELDVFPDFADDPSFYVDYDETGRSRSASASRSARPDPAGRARALRTPAGNLAKTAGTARTARALRTPTGPKAG